MVDIVKLKFLNRIISKNKYFIQSAIYKLIHLEKANLVQHKNVKRNIKTGHTKANAKIKQLRSDTEFTKKSKSVAISTSLPKSNILAIPNYAFDSNQACLTATSPFLYKAADIYLSIYKEENIQDPMRLNILYILINLYNENQAKNIFHQMLYQILCSLL